MLDTTPLLRLHARRRLAALARQDPARVQETELRRLLARAARTRFGIAHDFASIRSVAEYQARVPLRRYEDFWTEWWAPGFPVLRDATWPGRIPYFALTSGTTGANTKRIPVSRDMLRANRRAALDVLVFHLANNPRSRVLRGRNFVLGGSTALERLAPGVRAGDLSGIAAAEVPWWARPRFFPPRALALIADWDRKLAALAPRSLAQHITSFSGTPSWMLLFLDRLATLHPERPRRLAAFYPGLELVVHGGVGFAPYAALFAQWLEGSHAETREVYPASEGFIAIADRGPDEGMRMILDNGLFYEFARPDALDAAAPGRRWIADAETGVEYALIVTTNAGLWSYILGDTVILTDRVPPRLIVSGRTSWTLSAFGEHVTGYEIETALLAAARTIGATMGEYAVGAIPPDGSDARGGHLFVVEFSPPPPDETAHRIFSARLDAELSRLNADYAAHRQGDFGMRPPRLRAVPRGSFAEWMRHRGKLGGQNKVPRVINDPALLDDLRAFIGG